jgi:flagella basal body P-ring formation protein FlgA
MRAAALVLGFLGLVAMSAALHAAAPQAAMVQAVALKASGTASGPNILLGDVVEGLPAAAAALSLKPSGQPGSTASVDAALVALKLRNAPGGPYALSGGAKSLVSVGLQQLPGASLRQFASDFLASRLSGVAGVQVTPLGAVADLKLYSAPVRLQAAPLEDGQLRGNLVMRVQVMQEGAGGVEKEAASVPVSFLIKRQESRLVATQVIRKGDLLGPENLALRDLDATYDDRGFSSLDQVAGKAAKAYIGAGKPLTRAMVEFPPLIKRGDVLRVLVRSGAVVIEASGTAMRDAREGESLPVQMSDTKKLLQARCAEAGVVVYEAR